MDSTGAVFAATVTAGGGADFTADTGLLAGAAFASGAAFAAGAAFALLVVAIKTLP